MCAELKLTGAQIPTAEEVYDDARRAVGNVEGAFAGEAQEYDKAGYEAAKQAFMVMVNRARRPRGDPQDLYLKQLVEIDRYYPLRTEEQRKANSYRNQLLKTCAKAVLDRYPKAPE